MSSRSTKKTRIVGVPEFERMRDYVSSSGKRFFVIVSPPIPTRLPGKTARRVLVFDNHPESLRLALKVADEFDAEKTVSPVWEKRRSLICISILLVILAAAMLSPLWL
jgi:hypothetical protein